MTFDPNAAARPGSGIFGLPHGREDAALVLVPVPFDATTSYRPGAADGPEAIRAAGDQVDLFDLQTGRSHARGIHMLPDPAAIRERSAAARELAAPLLRQGGGDPKADRDVLEQVARHCEAVNEGVHDSVAELLDGGKLVGVVGGDHAVPFGAIRAAAARRPGLGLLHVDAHADLRRAYEGVEWSHASIMDNVLRRIPEVARIVQVGVRDFCEEEVEAIRAADGRVVTWFELDLRRRLAAGEAWAALLDEIVGALPEEVWVSFDIDGLDASLCPNTGTPVPGGLSFAEACLLLEAVARSGRRIVGFDLCEVAPGDGRAGEWDAVVGARVLYKLCGFALLTG